MRWDGKFRASGLEVLTCLSGRSPRTRRLADSAGFRDLPSLETLAEQADLILSILVPEAAVALAEGSGQGHEKHRLSPGFCRLQCRLPGDLQADRTPHLRGWRALSGHLHHRTSSGQGTAPPFLCLRLQCGCAESARRARHCRQVDRQRHWTGPRPSRCVMPGSPRGPWRFMRPCSPAPRLWGSLRS